MNKRFIIWFVVGLFLAGLVVTGVLLALRTWDVAAAPEAGPATLVVDETSSESAESREIRLDSQGTGYVYVDENTLATTEPSDQMYVLEIVGTFPKITAVEVMYMWQKNEGAERMVCMEVPEMSDGANQVFYCEVPDLD
ncbi:MAG: hypothetical protein UW68_C0016G0024 [Candidatus Collierbacteria bacterium GW2011_GWB1_44_6]|uniref:Uncharacterized protein n=2 Tax=Candidatus Collieribacteriota TaxID=1752725 RepID=A0A0G1MMD0_9BACT|nr:MAG: hypothetical protein UV68_C0017G0009 [Candidatus Collierbacteria bacterium GW2011_GWC2_43_12]KKT73144.1 MAG: hypothetical protein UW68_C0016G0024 [Candidatus Collierbacteria bacterium GW2011_GWB1_44_6]